MPADAAIYVMLIHHYSEPFLKALVIAVAPALIGMLLSLPWVGRFLAIDRASLRLALAGYSAAFVLAPVRTGFWPYDFVILALAGIAAISLFLSASARSHRA